MNVLIIGGTRNVGFFLANTMHEAGHHVTVLNRGITRDELPPAIERLRADRTETAALRRTLSGRAFDAVVDATLYNADEANAIVDILNKRTSHYIFLSSGQVYLVREGLMRPFHEHDYEGRLLPPPKPDTYAYEEWLYGMNKRNAEDVFAKAAKERAFPVTTLRLPMVNGERDHFFRLYNYVLRLQDGGPILVPTTPKYPLRHIYGKDVVRAIMQILESGSGKGKAYNLSQEESVSLGDFLNLVGSFLGVEPQIVRVNRDLLEANGFLPDCSPFSERWMSELDNSLSKQDLGITYTPLATYLEQIVRHYQAIKPPKPTGYRRRRSEIKLVETLGAEEK